MKGRVWEYVHTYKKDMSVKNIQMERNVNFGKTGTFGKRKIRRCVLLFGCCAFMAVVGNVGMTQAYLIDGVQKDNETRIGTVDVKIKEDFEEPDNILPGQKIAKRVQVENTGSAPCYVRVKAIFSDTRMEKYCEIDWNQSDWVFDAKESYFYYKKILKPGEKTTNLMTEIAISADCKEEDLHPFQLMVYTEACQVGSFDDWKDAWTGFLKNR